jgi:DNA polymerase I
MPERTLVVSATNVLARGFQVVPIDRRSEAGEPVNGLFSVTRAIAKGLAFKLPARAVAIVNPTPVATWSPLLAAQLPRLIPLLRTLGLPVIETADELDLVASYARAALDAGDDVVVVGTDKRYAQLVGDRAWWYDPNKDARYTTEMVVKRFGVPPAKVAEWLALVGDDDAMPGLAGIGAKGATGLLEAHGTIAGAIAKLDSIPGRAGNALRAALDQVPAEIARGTLVRDRPLPVPLAELPFAPPPAGPRNTMYRELGFVEYLAADGEDRVTVELCETAEAIAAALTGLRGATALHVLTEDPSPVRGALVGIALSRGDRRAYYVPIGDALDPALAAWLADPAVDKLGHDLMAPLVALERRGLALAGSLGDSACASHLAQPSNWAPHDLALVAKQVLGRALPDEEAVRGVGRQRKAWAALTVDRAGELAGESA